MKVRFVVKVGMLYLICAAVLAGASTAFFNEYSSVYLMRGTTNQQIDQFAAVNDKLPLPSSGRTSRDLLLTCAQVVLEAPRLKADIELNHLVRFNCARLARSVLASTPVNGRAWATLVLMDSAEWDTVRIKKAQESAPYEPIPLQLRLAAYAEGGNPPVNVRPLIVNDISRALETRWGREVLARLYLRVPSIRDLAIEAAKATDSGVQADFLRLVQRAAKGS